MASFRSLSTRFCLLLLALWGLYGVGLLPLAAREGRYPENLVWRLITERELARITNSPESFREGEHQAPPLFPQPQVPLGGLEVTPSQRPLINPQLPTTWEAPPFAPIGPPAEEGVEGSLKPQPAPQLPTSFGAISTATDGIEKPAPNLRPVKNPYLARLLQPDKRLPVPFSLRRYHTKSLGFFQIAAYGNETGLLAERDFNTLKSAAPNRRMLKGFGEQAFISFLPAPEPPKPFDLETAQGEFTFSDLEPEGEPLFEQLNPGLIKSSRAPSFQKIGVVEELPANFEDELRRQLAAAPYRGISLDTTSPDNSEPPSQPAPKAKATPPTPAPSLASAPEDAPDLNPFAVRTNFERSPQGMYVLVIYYPQQSLVCELAADTRFANLQSFLNIAILVQTRLKRW